MPEFRSKFDDLVGSMRKKHRRRRRRKKRPDQLTERERWENAIELIGGWPK